MLRKTLSTAPVISGDRTARFVISDNSVDRTGEQVVQEGLDVSLYLRNPIVLFSHNAEMPIGVATKITRSGGATIAEIKIVPPGTTKVGDETWALLAAGVLRSVSIGFDPIVMEPMDPSRPRGPQRYKKAVLCEISIVAIPALTSAVLLEASNAKSMTSDGGRGARMARLAEVQRIGRKQLARAYAAGNVSAPSHKGPDFAHFTRAERIEYARGVAQQGGQPGGRAPLPLREAESVRNAKHASDVGWAQRDAHPSREARMIMAERAARKYRPL